MKFTEIIAKKLSRVDVFLPFFGKPRAITEGEGLH